MDLKNKYFSVIYKEIPFLLMLLAIFIFFAIIFAGHQGNPIIDCGREAYIPSQMLKGQVLYKDIFNIYGPLAYQINAFLFNIFGENLKTLYVTGIFNSVVIVLAFYFIARSITDKILSFVLSILVISAAVFDYYIFNFIFPYSYAMSYAFSSFLLSVLFCILYYKNTKSIYAFLSCFFAGVSFACKYEYTFYILFLFIFLLAIKPLGRRNFISGIFAFLSVPFLSFFFLFIQGLTVNELMTNLFFIKKMMSSHTLDFFYTNTVGFFFKWETLALNLNIFINSVLSFLFYTSFIFFVLYAINYKKSERMKLSFIIKLLLLVLFTRLILNYLPDPKIMDIRFSWLPVTTALIFISIFVYFTVGNFSVKSIPELIGRIRLNLNNLSLSSRLFIILVVIALISSLKPFFFLNLHLYGTYIFPLTLLVNSVLIYKFIPNKFTLPNKELWKKAFIVYLAGFSILFFAKNYIVSRENYTHPVSTNKGTIHTTKDFGLTLNNTLRYIQTGIKSGESILVLPEGHILNFLTDHPSNNYYHSLIPIYAEVFGEDKIILDLEKNLPDYILINNRPTNDYGFSLFCKDYAVKICSFIFDKYEYQGEIGQQFKMLIFKRKSQ